MKIRTHIHKYTYMNTSKRFCVYIYDHLIICLLYVHITYICMRLKHQPGTGTDCVVVSVALTRTSKI